MILDTIPLSETVSAINAQQLMSARIQRWLQLFARTVSMLLQAHFNAKYAQLDTPAWIELLRQYVHLRSEERL